MRQTETMMIFKTMNEKNKQNKREMSFCFKHISVNMMRVRPYNV